MATAVALSLGDAIEQQNKLIRMGELNEHTNDGGYRVLGRMMEMRHELSKGANAPQRALTDLTGLTMDWKHFHNGPLLGLDRTRTQLLVITPVPPLPDLPDPSFEFSKFVELDGNRIPLASIPMEMRKTLKNGDGSPVAGLDGEIERPKMIKQKYVEHASGYWDRFMVFRPVTQVLYKMEGIVGMALIDFSADPYREDMPTFLMDPANGEGHFIGGKMLLR